MREWRGLIWLAASIIAVLALEWALRADNTIRTRETMTEMVYAPSYDAYEPNPNFADGRTLRPPVEGTIARGHLPLISGVPLTLETAAALVNPLEATPALVKQGAALFGTFCQVCHGPDGLGDGPVTKRGVPPPPPFTAESLGKLTDGQLYQVISAGMGNMSGYAAQVREMDRWKIVHHLRDMRPTP